MTDPVWTAIVVASGVVGVTAAAWRVWTRRSWHRLKSLRPTPVADLRLGRLARVEGTVVADDESTLLRSPIENRVCAGYFVAVERFSSQGQPPVPWWLELAEETQVGSFRIVGDDGHALRIDGDRFDVELHFRETGRKLDAPLERVRALLKRARRKPGSAPMDSHSLGYVEVALAPGMRVAVIGRVARESSVGAGVYRVSAQAAEVEPTEDEGVIHVVVEPPIA